MSYMTRFAGKNYDVVKYIMIHSRAPILDCQIRLIISRKLMKYANMLLGQQHSDCRCNVLSHRADTVP